MGEGQAAISDQRLVLADAQGIKDALITKSEAGLSGVTCQSALFSTSNNKYKVLRLCGDYTQMGEKYGEYLGPQIKNLYTLIYQQVGSTYGATKRQAMLDHVKTTYALYPERLKKIVAGLVSTSGATIEQLMVINEFFTWVVNEESSSGGMIKHNKRRAASGKFCSSMINWGAYTSDQSTVMGRNFDFPAWFKNFAPYLVVVGFNPNDGSSPTALLTYAGQVGAIQVFGKGGYVLSSNDGSSCGDTARPFNTRTSLLINPVSYLLEGKNQSAIDQLLLNQQTTYPVLFSWAHLNGGAIYETMTTAVKRRAADPAGLLIATNHFALSEWGSLPSPPVNSLTRFNNLKTLAEKYRGQINATVMRTIFDVPYTSGGVTNTSMVYQFVVAPAKNDLWIKAANYSDWTQIDLNQIW